MAQSTVPGSAAHNVNGLADRHGDVCLPLRRIKINIGNGVTNVGYDIFRGQRIQSQSKNIESTAWAAAGSLATFAEHLAGYLPDDAFHFVNKYYFVHVCL
jgi:hypothetical protein